MKREAINELEVRMYIKVEPMNRIRDGELNQKSLSLTFSLAGKLFYLDISYASIILVIVTSNLWRAIGQ